MRVRVLFLLSILFIVSCSEPARTSNVRITIEFVTEMAISSADLEAVTPTLQEVPTNTEEPLPTRIPIDTETAVPPTATESSFPTVKVIVNAANIRSGPGTDHSPTAAARAGEILEVIGLNDDGSWYEVRLPDGHTGWIGSSVVEAVDNLRITEIDISEQPKAVVVDTAAPENTPIPAPTEASLPSNEELATVVRIVDGDTIEVSMNGQTYLVRYIGINSAEYNDPCGPGATQANANLVSGQTVRLVKDVSETDPFDRLLRYVYVSGLFVNAELVRQGWALPVQYPPDTSQAAYLDSQLAGAPIPDCRQPPTVPPVIDQSTQPPEQIGPPAGVPANCTCSGPDLDCKHFGSHNSAQACYNYCQSLGRGDYYNLDGNDNDGLACESLP